MFLIKCQLFVEIYAEWCVNTRCTIELRKLNCNTAQNFFVGFGDGFGGWVVFYVD
ncbi:hypothetical protein HMPREF9104_03076 [Lentilactobacillus kisonensis F0435]|uniref:Uncharacterized protein n=1 Tax=Lentilactobacillus kisonensis F0435 TaxID=797516 RepID=H1LKD0_9LACO|nr:hypothetical protein HMPREF9104_03076 [Lentilactobacillus kisonensis F0435]